MIAATLSKSRAALITAGRNCMTTPKWDLRLTQQLLLLKLGKRHQTAYESLFSILDRLSHARYHYQRVAAPWATIMERARSEEERWRILGWGGANDEECYQRHEERVERSANLVACVQALHAIPDTLAFTLFYCLGIPAILPNKKERDISADSMIKWLENDVSRSQFRDLLNQLIRSSNYGHLSALSNHGKHRSIVSDTIFADATGTDNVPLRLRFRAFIYKDVQYASIDALPLLQQEFDRINPMIGQCGVMLNAYLQTLPDRARSA